MLPSKLIFQASALSSLGSLIVGLVSGLLWIPYSSTTAASAFGFGEGLAAIGLCTIASVFRSSLAVLAQACLHLQQPLVRLFLTAGQAFLCFGIAVLVLLNSPSAWALPLGWALSSAAVLLVGIAWIAAKGMFRHSVSGSRSGETSTFTFVWSRTLASLLGSAILQGDRWVIGAVAGPEFLAAYEIAWRVAVLPRFLIQNLAIAVSGDAGHIFRNTPRRIRRVLASSTAICAVIAALSSVAASVFYFVIVEPLGVASLPGVYFLLLAACTLIGITAPLSFLAVAVGLPSLDLPYLLLTASMALTAAFISLVTNSATAFIVGNAIAIVSGALWYLQYGNRALVRRCRQAGRDASMRMLKSA